MNKAQLIDLLAQRMDGDKRAASVAVEGVVDIVVRTVQAGENVTITGFGVFEKRSRAARVARNPRTGETVHVAPTSVPSFRPGTTFKAVVSGRAELPADAPAVKRTASAASRARTTAGSRAPATKAPATKAPAAKAPAAKAPVRKAPARAATSSAPKTAAAKAAAKAAAASAPPKAPKVEKPAKGKKVEDRKKKSKVKK
jgi:DNA-binding protein HU-beta